MRVLIITGIFPPDAGGPATYVPELARALTTAGHHVTVLTLSDRTDHPPTDCFQVIRLRRAGALPARWLRTVTRILREGRAAEVLYVNGLPLEATVANLWLGKPLVMKVVGDFAWERACNRGWTGDSFEEFQSRRYRGRAGLLQRLRAWWTRRANCVIVPSRYLHDVVTAWGVAASRIHVVYNAVAPLNGTSPAPLPVAAPLRVVTVGRLVALKNIDQVLEALQEIPEAGLVIVGDGPEQASLQRLAGKLGMASRVHFAGRCTPEQTRAFLAAGDLFVLNSSHEGLPHVLLEAMSHSLPVVATAVGGIPEVVEDRVNGRLVAPHRPEELRRTLAALVSNPEERRRLGAAARARAAAFSPAAMFEQTEALLRARAKNAGNAETHRGLWPWLREAFRQPLAGHAALLASSQYFATGIGLLTTLVATRLLGPADYGVAALAISYPALLWSFASFKPVSVLTRYVARFRAEGKEDALLSVCKVGYALDLATALLVLLVVLATAGWVAVNLFGLPEMAWLLPAYTLAFPFYSLAGTSRSILVSWERFFPLALLQVGESLLTIALVCILLLSHAGPAGLVLGMAAGQACWGLTLAAVASRTLHRSGFRSWWNAPFAPARPLARELMSFFGWNYLTVTLSGVVTQLPILLLGRLRGPEEAGFFRLAVTLTTAGGYVQSALGTVAYPALSSAWEGKAQEIPVRLRLWTRREGLAACLALLAVIPALPYLIPLLFGAAYEPVSTGAQWMLGASALGALFFWLNAYYYAAGQAAVWARAYFLLTLFVVGAGWMVIPTRGFLGMAAVVAVGQIIHAPAMAAIARRQLARRKAGASFPSLAPPSAAETSASREST